MATLGIYLSSLLYDEVKADILAMVVGKTYLCDKSCREKKKPGKRFKSL